MDIGMDMDTVTGMDIDKDTGMPLETIDLLHNRSVDRAL
jgi:hypothetical protein